MNNLLIVRGVFLSVVSALMVVPGCDHLTPTNDGSTGSAKESTPAERSADSVQKESASKSSVGENVTFYIAGMNRRLKIL